LVKIVGDNYMYAKVAKFIKSRKDFTEDKLEALEEIVMDEGKAKAIFEASKSSMGKNGWMDVKSWRINNWIDEKMNE